MPLRIRRAVEDDLVDLRDFHICNHLDESCHFAGEREHQEGELLDDFPQLYSMELFRRSSFWLSTEDGKIVGCIGITPDKDRPDVITWLNTFSVSKARRGRRIGSRLLRVALEAITTEKARLVTLGGHSKGKDVMGTARRAYEKNGFVLYRKETAKYGHTSTIDVMYYEKMMRPGSRCALQRSEKA